VTTMIGYCTECHKIKRVRVRMSLLASGRAPQGICFDCERARIDKLKRGSRRGHERET
jgi:hypothetical protein